MGSGRVKNRIRFFRRQRGLTQATLAARLATTAATVSRLETEDIRISTDWLKAIAGILEVPVADLIEDETRTHVVLAGHLDAHGRLIPTTSETSKLLPFLLGEPETVAAQLETDIGPYRRGEILVGERIMSHAFDAAHGRDCLVQQSDGDVYLRRFLKNPSKDKIPYTALDLRQGGGTSTLSHLLWVAPIRLVAREV